MKTDLVKQSSRHIKKVLSLLESINTSREIIHKIRKEMWFLHNDLVENLPQFKKEDQDAK